MRFWALNDGLRFPDGLTVQDIQFEWVPLGMPWWDPGKEINGNVAAFKAGLDNPYRVTKEMGRGTFEENILQLERANTFAAEHGVDLEYVMQPIENSAPLPITNGSNDETR